MTVRPEDGRTRRPTRRAGRVAAALLALGCSASALGEGTVFVLVSDERPLGDAQDVAAEADVPVNVLDIDELDRIGERVSESLAFVREARTEAALAALEADIQRIGGAAIEREAIAIDRAYNETLMAGEIVEKYGVTMLPAVIQIRSDGAYRASETVSSAIEAVSALRDQSFEPRPPAADIEVAGAEVRARKGGEGTPRTARARSDAAGGGTRYSVLQAAIDSSLPVSHDCIDARITGACLYFVVRIKIRPWGVDIEVGPEASLQITHSNPDLLVATSKRLGTSPLEEARLLYGALQNRITGIALPVITGETLPNDYYDTERWASASGAASPGPAGRETDPLRFVEVDVVGHPGMLFSHVREGRTNPVPSFLASLRGMGENVVNGVEEATVAIPAGLNEANAEITAIAPSLPDEATPTVPGDPIGEMFRVPGRADLLEMANNILPGGLANAAASLAGVAAPVSEATQVWREASDIAGQIESISTGITDAIDGASAVAEVAEVVSQIESIGAGLSMPGLGSGGTDLYSFCPSAGKVMKPYLLSGLDAVAWRFGLPEIFYPSSFKPPLPPFADVYVGNVTLRDGEGGGLARPNNWGALYPRQGWVLNADEMKGSAVGAARAVHVVTREPGAGQRHVYSPLGKPYEPYLDIEIPEPYSPIDGSTGKWQVVAPEVGDRCHVFGEDDGLFSPWSAGRQSEDKRYVFSYWREYACCPEPEEGSASSMVARRIGTIKFEIDLPVP